MRVAQNSLVTDKPVALEIQIDIGIQKCRFLWGEENWRTRILGARTTINKKLNPQITLGPGKESSFLVNSYCRMI